MYTSFLMNKVATPDSSRYLCLLTELNKIEFHYIMETDKNRSLEALKFRNEFVSLTNSQAIYAIMPGPATVLEVLIAMAERADDVMYDPAVGKRPSQWFWLFIHNLGLDYLVDANWTFDANNYIFVTVTKWMDRRFTPDGIGTPYPIPGCRANLQEVPIWDAMNWYLADNFETM